MRIFFVRHSKSIHFDVTRVSKIRNLALIYWKNTPLLFSGSEILILTYSSTIPVQVQYRNRTRMERKPKGSINKKAVFTRRLLPRDYRLSFK